MKKLFFFFILFALLFAFGCTEQNNVDQIKEKCISLCLEEKEKGVNLSNGPCLSNNIAPGWVCDVAHYPREPIDNDPQNQCPAYGKNASHFVEVTPDCKFIRAV